MSCPTNPAANTLAAGAIIAFASVWLRGSAVSALDFGSDEGRRDSTIAYTEGLRTYDNVKKYGAERVDDRDRQMFLPDGIRAGEYLVFPSLAAKAIYDDNIFTQPGRKTGDLSEELTPSVRLSSQFPNHILDMAVKARVVHFNEHSGLDYVDGSASVDGAFHFDHAHTLAASVLTSFEHDDRADPEAPKNAAEFVPLFHNRATLGLTRDAGRLYGTFSGTVESWRYQNVKAFDGSTINESARNLEVYTAEAKVGYRFSPGFEWQSKLRVLRNENSTAISQSNWGYEALSGLSLESNPLVRWHVLAGFALRDYDRTAFGTTSATLLEGRLQWLATQNMTVYVTGRRELASDVTASGKGRIDNTIKGRIEYEVLRNLVLTGTAGFIAAQYEGADRDDRSVVAGLGLQYFHTKNILLTADYEYLHRTSTMSEFNLDRNKYGIGVKIRF